MTLCFSLVEGRGEKGAAGYGPVEIGKEEKTGRIFAGAIRSGEGEEQKAFSHGSSPEGSIASEKVPSLCTQETGKKKKGRTRSPCDCQGPKGEKKKGEKGQF